MNRLLLIGYELSLWLLALVAIPKVLYHFVKHKKYHQSLWQRLGINYPPFQRSEDPLIWIHAVSVGETKAVVSLARELKRHIPKSRLVISSVTETGHAEAKRSLSFADQHVYLPFDFYFLVKKLMKQASPQLVILCESDFWFNFLRCAKAQGASLVLVNGKLSEESANRFHSIPLFSKTLFNLFDSLCVQNELYQKRFLHALAPQEKIRITGNLKLDDEHPQLSPEEVVQWKQKLGIDPHQPVLTIGSSHHPEERLFIQLLKEIWKTVPQLKVLLVPRHPERFKEVEELLESERVLWISFTDIARQTGKEQAILIDAMGMLRMCYQLSDLALVGGSFTSKVGGHNILEPCWYGKPVLFGPYMHAQVELVNLIREAEAGLQVQLEEVGDILNQWLQDAHERQQVGNKGLSLVGSLKGSTQRTVDIMEPWVKKLTASLHS